MLKHNSLKIRKNLLHVVGFLLMLGVVSQTYAETGLPSVQVFSPDSFWYKTIPLNVQLHENSAAFVTEFQRQKSAYYGTVNINTWSYASPVYYVGSGVPTTPVEEWDCQKKKI